MTPPRRRGRQPLTAGDLPARLHVTIPSRDYDQAQALARRDGLSVAEVVRRGLQRALADEAEGRAITGDSGATTRQQRTAVANPSNRPRVLSICDN
jgi:hypothetical protein